MKHILTAAFLLMSAAFVVAQGEDAQTGAAQAGAAQSTTGTQETNTAQSTNPPSTKAPSTKALEPLEPEATGEPHTEMLDTGAMEHDPLLEPKPLPRANLSLIGGIARKVDTVRNRVTVQPFGGGTRYLIYFDDRTRILSGGRETTVLGIHPGDRIYVDTQTLGARVFARTIEVRRAGAPAQASGQVILVLGGEVRMQDRLSGEAIEFAISDKTKVDLRGAPSSTGELRAGSLIDVTFLPGPRRSDAQSITIHASPGESYVFAGVLTNIDLRDGLMALDDQVDGNNYELYFDPLSEKSLGRLVTGTAVRVTASFDGKRYRATSIKIQGAASNR
jgi:hypothetical protein